LVGVIYPLLRFTPALYGWQIRRRIFRMYGELKLLEKELESRSAGPTVHDLNEQLNWLEEKASHLRVPLFYASLLYTLRMHITVVRERLERTERPPTADP
jgi:hypothetical protein